MSFLISAISKQRQEYKMLVSACISGLKLLRVILCGAARYNISILFICIKTHLHAIKREFVSYKLSSPSTGSNSLL